jgi:hypothetical protein
MLLFYPGVILIQRVRISVVALRAAPEIACPIQAPLGGGKAVILSNAQNRRE